MRLRRAGTSDYRLVRLGASDRRVARCGSPQVPLYFWPQQWSLWQCVREQRYHVGCQCGEWTIATWAVGGTPENAGRHQYRAASFWSDEDVARSQYEYVSKVIHWAGQDRPIVLDRGGNGSKLPIVGQADATSITLRATADHHLGMGTYAYGKCGEVRQALCTFQRTDYPTCNTPTCCDGNCLGEIWEVVNDWPRWHYNFQEGPIAVCGAYEFEPVPYETYRMKQLATWGTLRITRVYANPRGYTTADLVRLTAQEWFEVLNQETLACTLVLTGGHDFGHSPLQRDVIYKTTARYVMAGLTASWIGNGKVRMTGYQGAVVTGCPPPSCINHCDDGDWRTTYNFDFPAPSPDYWW